MPETPDIQILGVEHGSFPAASALNKKVDPALPILRVRMRIRWMDPRARTALSRMEANLRKLSSTFEKHECRGMRAYHVFRHRNSHRRPRRFVDSPQDAPAAFEPDLALAHLIEHAIIDFQSFITGATRCSGVTGALRDQPGVFDVMVECNEPQAGRCALAVALKWLETIAAGGSVEASEKDLLAAVRALLACSASRRNSLAVARRLGWTEERADEALSSLCEMGCLGRAVYTMNFSNVSEFSPPPM